MKRMDYVIVFAILGLALAFALTRTEQTGLVLGEDVLGSDGLPAILTVLAIASSIWLVIDLTRQKRKERAEHAAADLRHAVYNPAMVRRLLVFAAGTVLYLIAFQELGFCVSTFVYIALGTFYLEAFSRRSLVRISVFALVITGGCNYFFKIFNILVPDGLFF
jgi:hypothetical protein